MNIHYLPIYILMAILCGSFYFNYLPPIVFVIFVISSTFTFFIYAKDKRAAQNDQWRTPESTLHLCSLFFGWPGAIIAQQKLRHKSKKRSFRLAFMLTVLINFTLIGAIHTDEGVKLTRHYTGELRSYVNNNVENQELRKTLSFLFSLRKENYLYYKGPTFYIR